MSPMCLQRGDPSQRSGRRSAATRPAADHRCGRPIHPSARYLRPLAASAIATLSVLAPSGWLGASTASAASPASPPRPVISWKPVTPASSPPPLTYAAAAYDADNSTVVLFGGRAADGTLSSSTWVWNGSTWAQLHPAHSPPARELASMAFDPTLHQLILFGGQAGDGSLLGDTWAWNGASWIQVGAAGPAPVAREAAALAFEPSGSLLLFGGTGQAGGGESSSTSLPGVAAPPTQTVLGDTWLWTSAGWIRSTASGPPARSGAVAAYDESNGTTVLFGGEANPTSDGEPKPMADTWVWNRSGWAATKPSSVPPARFAAAADDFPTLGGPLVIAGDGASGSLADAWLWAGGRWTQPAVQGSVNPRIGAAAAYDAATDSIVLFGGEGGGGTTLGDTVLVGVVTPAPVPTTVSPTTTTTLARSTTSTSRPRRTPTTRPPTTASHGSVPTAPTTTLAPPTVGVVPTGTPMLRTAEKQVPQGGSVKVSGSGFAPASYVALSFHSGAAPLGGVMVSLSGTFTKVVVIPPGATAGEHHLTATGTTASGATATLTAAVTVLPVHHKGLSHLARFALLGLAILIPVAAYLAMAGAGMWRRRRRPTG